MRLRNNRWGKAWRCENLGTSWKKVAAILRMTEIDQYLTYYYWFILDLWEILAFPSFFCFFLSSYCQLLPKSQSNAKMEVCLFSRGPETDLILSSINAFVPSIIMEKTATNIEICCAIPLPHKSSDTNQNRVTSLLFSSACNASWKS